MFDSSLYEKCIGIVWMTRIRQYNYIYLQKDHQESNEWYGAHATDGSS